MLKRILKTVRGFSSVKLVIMTGFVVLAAGALIFLATAAKAEGDTVAEVPALIFEEPAPVIDEGLVINDVLKPSLEGTPNPEPTNIIGPHSPALTGDATIEVYPTGTTQDATNVQWAVDNVQVKGKVILKATDASGEAQYFNFGTGSYTNSYVLIQNEVVIMGESGSITIPDGSGKMADRTLIYGGGYGTAKASTTGDFKGAFTIRSTGSCQISNLWFEASTYSSIFGLGCNGCEISNNIIKNPKRLYAKSGTAYSSWVKGIAFGEWNVDKVKGNININNNVIEFEDPPTGDITKYPDGIAIVRITSSPKPYVSITNNTVKLPSALQANLPKGITLYAPGIISFNEITGTVQWTIYVNGVQEGVDIKNNTVAGTKNSGIVTLNSNNCVIQSNVIEGEGPSGITLLAGRDNYILDNDLSHNTATKDGSQISFMSWAGVDPVGNVVSGNKLGKTNFDAIGVVIVVGESSSILQNNFTQSDGPPGVKLLANTKYNMVEGNDFTGLGLSAGPSVTCEGQENRIKNNIFKSATSTEITLTPTSNSNEVIEPNLYCPRILDNGTNNTITCNHPPTINTVPDQITYVGDSFGLQLIATDPDGDTLTYSATGLPAWASIESSSGFITGIPTAAATSIIIATADDQKGGMASVSFSIKVKSPEELLQNLIDKIKDYNFKQGISNSLDAKLTNAYGSLIAANANVRQDAINKLQAFINECNAQSGNKFITAEQADSMIADANFLIMLLQKNY